MGVLRPLGGKPRAVGLVDQPHLDHLNDFVQAQRFDDHALARNDVDHVLVHEAVQRLMDRRPADANERRHLNFIDRLAGRNAQVMMRCLIAS